MTDQTNAFFDALLMGRFLLFCAQDVDVPHTVEDPGEQDRTDADDDEQIGQKAGHVREQQMQDHGEIQCRRGHLPVPVRGQNLLRPMDGQEAGDHDEQLLDAKDDEDIDRMGEADRETADHDDLGGLIRHGVQGLAQVADHVEAAGDIAVQNIGDPRQDQNGRRALAVSLRHIGPHEPGNEQQTEEGQKVGDGEQFSAEDRFHCLIFLLKSTGKGEAAEEMKYCQKTFVSLSLRNRYETKSFEKGDRCFARISVPFDPFPGHEVGISAEVPVAGQRLIDGPTQIEFLNDAIGGQVLSATDLVEDRFPGNVLCAKGLHMEGDWLRYADGVADLDLAPIRHPIGYDVFRQEAGHVGPAPVHLGGILPGEGAAPMAAVAAVGIADELPSSDPGVRCRTAHDESARGVDEISGVFIYHGFRQRGQDHLVHQGEAQFVQGNGVRVLGGKDHSVDPNRDAVFIFQGDLCLSIGSQKGHRPHVPHIGKALAEEGGKLEAQRHQGWGLAAGIAEHDALVPSTLLLRLRLHDPSGDVRGLLVDVQQDRSLVGGKANVGLIVANLPHGPLYHIRVGGSALGGDLPHDMDHVGGGGHLTGHMGQGVQT